MPIGCSALPRGRIWSGAIRTFHCAHNAPWLPGTGTRCLAMTRVASATTLCKRPALFTNEVGVSTKPECVGVCPFFPGLCR